MRKANVLLLLLLAIAINLNLQAQSNDNKGKNAENPVYSEPLWVNMMQDLSVNFYDVQKEFNNYFKDKINIHKLHGSLDYFRFQHFENKGGLFWEPTEKYNYFVTNNLAV